MNNLTQLSRKEKIELVKEYQARSEHDPITFIDRFFYTFNPRLPQPHIRFRLFPIQKELVTELKAAIAEGHDLFIDKTRDVGATYTTLAVFLWFWKFVPGSNFLLGSRKESFVDNRFGNVGDAESNKEESLFGKLDYMLRKLPQFMLPKGFNMSKHNGYMKIVNPENGNVISGESSNPNFSRGGRYKGVLLDEFAFWDNDVSAWGATADTSNCRIIITTPGIKPGKAKRLRFGKDGEKIQIFEIDKKDDPRKDAVWEAKERERRSKEDYAREVERNWETSVQGRVYEEIKYAQVGNFPYNPNWPLYQVFDFGLDGTAIGVWQTNLINGKVRLVDSFFKENVPIQFFFPLLGRPIDSLFTYDEEDLLAIEAFKFFKKPIYYGDPDVSKRAYQTKEVTSTRKELENIGVYVQTNPESNQFFIRREKTKVLLQRGIEVNDTPRNEFFMEAIRQARYPQRNENSQATTAIVMPIHDWTSHHRTQLEYLAVNYNPTEEESSSNIDTPDWAHSMPSWAK